MKLKIEIENKKKVVSSVYSKNVLKTYYSVNPQRKLIRAHPFETIRQFVDLTNTDSHNYTIIIIYNKRNSNILCISLYNINDKHILY